jgi:hypothetical protein
MKKLTILFIYVLASGALFSCLHNDHDVSLSYQDTDHEYSMTASYPKSNTRNVGEYMNNSLGARNNISFVNAQIDANLTLDDHTKFYIKKYPGYLEIKFNKEENSDESYREVKSMCQGLKKVLTR